MVLSRKLHIDSSFSTRSEAEGFVQEASPVEGYWAEGCPLHLVLMCVLCHRGNQSFLVSISWVPPTTRTAAEEDSATDTRQGNAKFKKWHFLDFCPFTVQTSALVFCRDYIYWMRPSSVQHGWKITVIRDSSSSYCWKCTISRSYVEPMEKNQNK